MNTNAYSYTQSIRIAQVKTKRNTYPFILTYYRLYSIFEFSTLHDTTIKQGQLI